MKLFFVYNPMSGRGQIRNKLFDIINVFSEAGYEITVHPTRAPKGRYSGGGQNFRIPMIW